MKKDLELTDFKGLDIPITVLADWAGISRRDFYRYMMSREECVKLAYELKEHVKECNDVIVLLLEK